MAYRYNIDASGGAFTALTIDGACTSAKAERSLGKYAGPANNKWEEIIEAAALDNDKLRLTASTNSSSSSRSGYGKIMYKINGNTCETILHVVQDAAAPTASGFKVNVAVPNGKTSAFVSLYDANNTYLCGITRYPGGTTGTAYNWTAQGTVAKGAVTENGSSCKYLTINGKTGTTLLAKTQINTGSTVTNLDLTKTFNTSDYNDGNAILYFTFTDS